LVQRAESLLFCEASILGSSADKCAAGGMACGARLI
jgi:hypothetical protein